MEDFLTSHDEKAMTKAKILDYTNLKLNTNKDNSELLERTQTTDYSTFKKQKY